MTSTAKNFVTFQGVALLFAVLCFVNFVIVNPLEWLNWALVTLVDWLVPLFPTTPQNLRLSALVHSLYSFVHPVFHRVIHDTFVNLLLIYSLSLPVRLYRFLNPFK